MKANATRTIRFAALAAALFASPALAETPSAPDPSDWEAVKATAKGEHVHWYAWGGESHINDYIAWVGDEVAERFGVTLTQIKLADTAEAVARVLAETTAGRDQGGAVDLIWINGENFVSMKENGLLFGERWAEALPHYQLVDLDRYGEAILTDFGVPVDGQEAPWGRAQLTLMYDSARAEPPRSLDALMAYAADNPGRFTYPQPPDFLGTAFLKQVLLDRVPNREVLLAPAGDNAADLVRTHLIPTLRALHPNLWRSGRVFPQSVAEVRQLFSDGALDIALTNNPSDAEAAIRNGLLPPTIAVSAFENGTIGNVHFVAIPHNANDKAGALVVANFLLSPEAQARKADPDVWGDPTVLNVAVLPEDQRAAFENTPSVDAPTLREPHASWTPVIERVWAEEFLQ